LTGEGSHLSRGLINLVNQLDTADLTLPQLVQTLEHTLKTPRANFGRVDSELLAGEELGRKLPESLAKLEVLRLRGELHTAEELEGFASDGVAESSLHNKLVDLWVPGQEVGCSPCSQHQYGRAWG